MTPAHRLLVRQVRKHFPSGPPADASLSAFLGAVQDAYEQYDSDRLLLDRAMKLSSDELSAAVESLRQQNALEHAVLVKLRASIRALGTTDLSVSADSDNLVELAAVIQQLVAERNASKAALEAAKEAAESSSRAKSEFLAVMSHEIRTPLNAVIGFASLMAETPGADHSEHVQIIRRSGEHLLAVINDILDFSKIDAGRIEFARKPLDLPTTLRDSLDFVRKEAAAKGLALRLEGLDALPTQVLTDPARFRQILVNLLGNAVKFTSRGHVTLRTEARAMGETWNLRCDIIDTGIGIAPDQAARLFRPFTQVDSSEVRPHGGTGLGLAISRRLAELMGGSLDLRSTPGIGSTFTLCLPVGALAPAAVTVTSPLRPPGAPLRLLIAEDHENNRKLMRLGLESAGYQIQFAHDGRAAAQALEKAADFDLVFLDLQMPHLDGFGVIARLRQHVPVTAPPYVIALTATVRSEDRARALAAGVHEFMPKPAPIAEIRAAIDRARTWLATHGA